MSQNWVCDNCGQDGAKLRFISRSYGTAETLHKIERIKRYRLQVAKPRPVPVANFAVAR